MQSYLQIICNFVALVAVGTAVTLATQLLVFFYRVNVAFRPLGRAEIKLLSPTVPHSFYISSFKQIFTLNLL